jgi:hypothetical protein
MKCCEQIWHNEGNWGGYHPCSRNATVERNGKHYCTQHDPEEVATRRKKLNTEYRTKMDAEIKRRQLERAAPDLLAALQAAERLIDTVSFDQPEDLADIARIHAAIAKATGGGGA